MENNIVIKKEKEKEKSNRRPGRPRIQVVNTKDIILGVREQANNEKNHMELIYNDPKLFKKIISIFKGYFVDDIFIAFNSDNIQILSSDNTKKTIIKIVINCNKINEYYCRKSFEISVKREYLEKIFNTIEKQHNKIIFYSDKDTYLSTLHINLLNDELGINDNYVIDLTLKPNLEKNLNTNIDLIVKEDYLLQFKLQSKIFKKFVNDSINNSKLLKIEKYGNEPLKFKMTINNKVAFTRIFKAEEKFDIKSKLRANEYFNINLEIDSIKPFSNINVSNYVNIYLDNDKKAIFEANVNNDICIISIYNEILTLVSNE
jgi:hypothetical protein